MGKLYIGQTGVKIILETGQDLSSASQVSILVKKPDTTEEEWSGTINGTTIEYTTQTGDFNKAGIYRLQAKVVFANGSIWYGETAKLVIYEKFE